MRLQKFLSRAGVASRRKSEELIVSGRVRVDGLVVTELGTRVDPAAQSVEVDGQVVHIRSTEWLVLHKPPGHACTRGDPQNRPTIYDLIPPESQHLFHVGRLDFMSEGLLLLSNEGDLAHRLLHPSSEVARRYEVVLVGPVPRNTPAHLVSGVELDDGPAAARSARWLTDPASSAPELELVLSEGRNREIRRMVASRDLKIRALRRVAFGPVELGTLGSGLTRRLSDSERGALMRAAGVTG